MNDDELKLAYYVVDFTENDGSLYSIAIKADHYPTKDELVSFLARDMEFMGYTVDNIADWYEVDEAEVYCGYDTTRIDFWPILTY